ncbi:MAG: leucine--tRNA ligase [Saprospirales bacterium]|nr:MAG: leucine--tRNA ligase [Saprospirales bacterium]
MEYNAREIELKWQRRWTEENTYKVIADTTKKKFYILDMFPYPSGAGLHVGHPLGYIASDIISRYKRHNGYQVLHPMGYDAFGLPAEQYALQTGIHPAESTRKNIARYREQLTSLGFDYDWSRSFATCDPDYYKWTQWIFLKLFDHYYCKKADKALPISKLIEEFEKTGNIQTTAFSSQQPDPFDADEWKKMNRQEKDEALMNYRLAYRKLAYVNWCEALGTVLANDEVKDGLSERGGFPVERKAMLQWSIRISAYADRLLVGLDKLEWSDPLKIMQRNWIGKSTGAKICFDIVGFEEKIEVFTTRPDTLFGSTFMVLAPEHPLVDLITTPENKPSIEKYRSQTAALSEKDRQSNIDQISGKFTGGHAIHPFTGKKLPVWISDYVLMEYGTGAIMAVPSDDERDNKFANHFGLPIIEVYDKSKGEDENGFIAINSDFINGLGIKEAKEKMIDELSARNIGEARTTYKLRDANFSRQRYWGEPIPVVYDEEGVCIPLKEKDLPVELPDTDNFQPGKDGRSPLSRIEDWVNLPDGYKRETDTMPGFAGSSWYFLRYMDPKNTLALASKEAITYWESVDLYIGGTEHAVGHLIYSRSFHKFLFDIGIVPTDEPFKKLINQGMIQGIIESVYLDKRVNSPSRFVCKTIAEREGLENFSKILVHADFVENYGNPESFLSKRSIDQFSEWQKSYQNAIFECNNGYYQNGVFSTKKGAKVNESHLITHSEVGKMSKSKFNVINPDDVINEYGTDCFRMYEMFLGPIEQSKPWDTMGIEGVSKFLKKFWSLFFTSNQFNLSDGEPSKEALVILHNTIKRIREDIDRFSFNTCVSHFMVCTNELRKLKCNNRDILEQLIILISPFAPHIAEELWSLSGHKTTVTQEYYPAFNPEILVKDEIVYPIAVNGKKRTEIAFSNNASKEEIEVLVRENEVVKKWQANKEIRRVIIVPKKMVNIVIG